MTAIDAAVQSKLLGAEEVTIVYRRGHEKMNASEFEQELAASEGVLRHWLRPRRLSDNGKVTGIELRIHRRWQADRRRALLADHVFKAIGQA